MSRELIYNSILSPSRPTWDYSEDRCSRRRDRYFSREDRPVVEFVRLHEQYRKCREIRTHRVLNIPADFALSDSHARVFSYILGIQTCMRNKLGMLRSKEDCWVSIHCRKLRERFGSTVQEKIQDLVAARFIIVNGHYLVKSFTKSYKVPGAVMSGKWTTRVVRRTQAEKNRVSMIKDGPEFVEDTSGIVERYSAISRGFTIDPKCHTYISQEYMRRVLDAESYPYIEDIPEDDPNRLINNRDRKMASANSWMLGARQAVECIESKDWWVKKCIAGRIHTPITNMPSALKGFLRQYGERLAEIDISNSQPAMLGGIMSEWREEALAGSHEGIKKKLQEWDKAARKPKTKMREIIPEERYKSEIARLGGYENVHGEIEIDNNNQVKSFKSRYTTEKHYAYNLERRASEIAEALKKGKEDLEIYIQDTSEGQYYERISEISGLTRKQTKQGEMSYKFGKTLSETRLQDKLNSNKEQKVVEGKTAKAIKERYPTVDKVVSLIKEETYPASSIGMQKKESSAMICEELISLEVATVHDSGVPRLSVAEEAEKIIKRRLEQAKVKATVKIKQLEEPELTWPKRQKQDRESTTENQERGISSDATRKKPSASEEASKFTTESKPTSKFATSVKPTSKFTTDSRPTSKVISESKPTSKASSGPMQISKFASGESVAIPPYVVYEKQRKNGLFGKWAGIGGRLYISAGSRTTSGLKMTPGFHVERPPP